jgi:pimeloyl-ACP methyl ester carboxylesterase
VCPKPSEAVAPLPLHAETHGEGGTSILLLHGFGTSGYTWNRWVPTLSKTHIVHVLDLKGFGAAPKPRDHRYSPLDQASLVTRWILQNDLRELTLVGHSLGGGVALLTALDLQEVDMGRVRRLVIVAGIAYPQPISRYLRLLGTPLLGPLVLRVLPMDPVIRTALRRAYYPANPVSESHVAAYAAPLRTPGGRSALSRSAAQLMTPELESVTGRYGEISIPCLLLWGRNDPVVPLWVGRRLAEELPDARLEILNACGHMPQEERAEETLEHLRCFLDETG